MDAPRGGRDTAPMATSTRSDAAPAALAGLKVLELGQLIAGPFAAKTLADFGAEVIKVEPPGAGDPLRRWRMLKDGTSVWWQVQSRNARGVGPRDPDREDHGGLNPRHRASRSRRRVPRPRLHLIRSHAVLAPNAKLRARVVPQGSAARGPAAGDAQPADAAG